MADKTEEFWCFPAKLCLKFSIFPLQNGKKIQKVNSTVITEFSSERNFLKGIFLE